jgi:hypothetical protein
MTPWYLSTKGVLEAAIGSSSFNCSVIVSHNIPSYFIEIHATVPPPLAAGRLSLLLATIHGSKGSMASGGLGVLTTHANAWDRGTAFSHGCRNKTRSKYVQMLFERMEKCPKADLKLGFLNSSPILC